MRSCDLCNAPAPEAKSADSIIVALLKEAQITNVVRAEILDKLKIKHSVFQAAPTFGDVCDKCSVALEADMTKAISDSTKALTERLAEIARATKARMMKTSNELFFEQMSGDSGWGRMVRK